jgi:hypothetical protein
MSEHYHWHLDYWWEEVCLPRIREFLYEEALQLYMSDII